MPEFLENILLELALFIFLGLLYYFYQRRKILHFEENKTPLIMGFILQSCLADKNESSQPQLDTLIEALDDYLHNRSATPPYSLLQIYMDSPQCSQELKDIIREGILEIEEDGKK